MNKEIIKSFFRKAYDKLLRKKTGREPWREKFDGFYSEEYISKKGGISKEQATEMFRKMFEEAYPDAAKFLGRLQSITGIKGYDDIFQLRGNFCATGFVSAEGLQTDYLKWEDDTVKAIEMKYTDLKVLVFHYSPDDKCINQ